MLFGKLYEKLVGVFASIEFQNNYLVLLLKTISRYRNCFLSPVATDGMDGSGLKLEKIGLFFRVLMLHVPNFLQKIIMVSPLY